MKISEIIEVIGGEVIGVNESTELEIKSFEDVLSGVINKSQFEILRGRTPRKHIKTRPGKGGKTFSYVEHGYVTKVLNTAFGFAWSFEILPQGDGNYFVYLPPVERDGERMRPGSVLVHGKLTVHVHNPDNPAEVLATIIKTSTGEKEELKGMTWGGHLKSAESDALKKAASRVGIALDLYWADADEDYIEEQAEQARGGIDSLRLEGKSDAEIAKRLSDDGMGRSAIAKAMDVPIKDVVGWLKKDAA
jgi:hypothetical protein